MLRATGLGRQRAVVVLLLLACTSALRTGRSARLDLRGYQEPDGAITLHAGGDLVDPYFATKALLAARAAGADVGRAGRAWVAWAAARQLPDGRFERQCRAHAAAPWSRCWDADADDALAALWLELLHELAPSRSGGGLPLAWRPSAESAERHLAVLRDPSTGVYRVSRTQPAALLMDNVEIYGALAAVARARRRLGDAAGAERAAAQADTLAAAIGRVFRRPGRRALVVSTQQSPDDSAAAFYPYAVAELYPWLAGLPAPAGEPSPREAFARWLARHGERWLAFTDDPYPWGLVALTAARLGDGATARRWLDRAAPLRGTVRWNVLEEAIFQALGRK
ncbi:MAG TPA: hypothetical protein VKA84_01100 [Gemmatimonadaceae bacterium]|nr:hypothetical protein [Gemmatimonadaceae bacterium]